MTGRPEKLKSSREIGRVFARGRRANSDDLAVHAVRTDPQHPSRLAFAAAKAQGSVLRNRIRRRLREASRPLDLQPGFDCVIVGRPSAAASDLAALSAQISQNMEKLGILQ